MGELRSTLLLLRIVLLHTAALLLIAAVFKGSVEFLHWIYNKDVPHQLQVLEDFTISFVAIALAIMIAVDIVEYLLVEIIRRWRRKSNG